MGILKFVIKETAGNDGLEMQDGRGGGGRGGVRRDPQTQNYSQINPR